MRGLSPTKYAEFKVEKLNDRLIGSARDLTTNFMDIKQRIRSKNNASFDPQRERFKPKTMFLQQEGIPDSTKANS